MKQYYEYIMSNHSRTLYTGVTNNLARRVLEHRNPAHGGFAARYLIHTLVYYESQNDIRQAIAREKQIKGWKRERKIALVEKRNPGWLELLM